MKRVPPYHKNLDPLTQAGQVVNKDIKTIGDYVKKVEQQEKNKPMTFDEWLDMEHPNADLKLEDPWLYKAFENCWNASRENM